MNEHELCCGTVADKARLCAEIAARDRVIEAQQRRIGELLHEVEQERQRRFDGNEQASREHREDLERLVEAAAAALGEIDDIMQEAYNSAYPVCCGRPGSECCGSPEPEWAEADHRMMDRLAPHQDALRAALATTSTLKAEPWNSGCGMAPDGGYECNCGQCE